LLPQQRVRCRESEQGKFTVLSTSGFGSSASDLGKVFNDFIGETHFLSNNETSVYLKLFNHYLHEEKPLKNNMIFLQRLCGGSEEEVMNVLNLFFELKEESWRELSLLAMVYDDCNPIEFSYEINDMVLYPICVITMLNIFDLDCCIEEYLEFSEFMN
jgi:hypothetical protein